MKLHSVTFGRTVSKNYQSQKCEVTIELGEGDTFASILAVAKRTVARGLGEAPSPDEVKKAKETLSIAGESEVPF